MWHTDLERVPEIKSWTNIGYCNKIILDHFCNMVDLIRREFGVEFTTEQIIRLAECTPGMTAHNPTPVPEDYFAKEVHNAPIRSKERIERHIDWKTIEE